jgi:hypothetical protein
VCPETGSGCSFSTTKKWTVTDACGNTGTASQTVNYKRDTIAPVITLTDAGTLPCNPTAAQIAAAFGTASVTDNCSSGLVASGTVCPETGSGCSFSTTKKWTVTDACGNTGTASQTVNYTRDTHAPVISCPANYILVESGTVCPDHPDPATTGKATATDNCDPNPTITYSDAVSGTCPKTITRTWTVSDHCGNSASCPQTITCTCQPSLITDTMRCTLLPTSCSANNSIRLIWSQDPQNPGCYKCTASNPGQFYFNAFFHVSDSSQIGHIVTFNVTIPYPFVTQGANPVEAYDFVTVSQNSAGQTCLIPSSNKILAGTNQVPLANYSPQAIGSTQTIAINVVVPPTGQIFLAVHLDYGLKGTTGYTPDSLLDTLKCGTTTPILIANPQAYNFSVSGAVTDSTSATTCNDFKKTPGTAGIVLNSLSLNPVPNSNVVLKDSTGKSLGSGVTDNDGWYMINYKWTGKAATFNITMTPPTGLGKAQTQTITLKANGFIEADFKTP